ncbi:protein trichome birefringence-like 26 [Musa acuminata AAA Group]
MGKEVEPEAEPCIGFRDGVCKFLVILLGSSLIMALSYQRFLYSATADTSSSSENAEILAMNASKGQCDLSSGEWIPDARDPAYSNSTCSFISSFQDCLTNGRPDTGYLHWRWKPYGCELPRFDANKFLNRMRNKSLGFVGDSVFRNQMESLLCLLSEVEEAVLVYHDETFQTKTWHLPSHNATLGLIWAPFLIKSTQAISKNHIQLYLDVLDDTWTSQYHKYDYVMISGGQWFLKETIFWENNTVVGCHFCTGMNLMELGMDYSYRRALRSVFDFVSSSEHKPLVVLRTWTPTHFEHGMWYNGGICNRTKPYKESESTADPVDVVMRDVEEEGFKEGVRNGLRLRLLDTYHLSALRPDGHPGPYRRFHPDISKKPQNDCLHWCLPGIVDTWNDMLMEILMGEEELISAL